jgi:hypothetical protein
MVLFSVFTYPYNMLRFAPAYFKFLTMSEELKPEEALSNIDEAERGKIENTIKSLDSAAQSLRKYLAYIDELTMRQIPIVRTVSSEQQIPINRASSLGEIISQHYGDTLQIEFLVRNALSHAEKSADTAGGNIPEIRKAVEDRLKTVLD